MNKLEDFIVERPKIIERFWSHVDKKEPDECWLWTSKRKQEYGWFRVDMKGKTHEFTASRVALFLSGTSVKGWYVLHSCDTPSCCNPAHLRTGTHQDNMDDMKARGRHAGRPRKHFDMIKLKDINVVRSTESNKEVLRDEQGTNKAT